MWNALLEFWATNGEFSCDRLILSNKWRIFLRPLNVSPDFAVVIIKACVVLHNFVRERDCCKFEDALTVTVLEDVPDGQSVRGGLTANSVRNTAADYFLTDAGAASWQMSKIWTVEYIKWEKDLSLYELQSAVFNKLRQYSPKAFFWAYPRASKSSWRQIQTSLYAFFVSFLSL